MEDEIRLNSLYLCVEDMDRAIAFYEALLDMPVAKRDKVLSRFDLHGFRLCLFAYRAVGESVTRGDSCLPSFDVRNMPRFMEKLKKLQAPLVFPLTRIGENLVLEFRDSEGNDIEVYSPAETDE